jgi:hypothetical protein
MMLTTDKSSAVHREPCPINWGAIALAQNMATITNAAANRSDYALLQVLDVFSLR